MRVIGLLLATLALTTVCADKTFSIVDNGGLTTAFRFNFSGTLVDTPILNVTVGEKLTFRIETALQAETPISFGLTDSFAGNPRDFSSPALGGLNTSSGCVPHPEATFQYSWYTSNVSNPCIITWTVVQPDLEFFYTSKYKAMVGRINATSAATSAPPTGSITTSPPTGTTGTTTTAPTTPSPTGSSTGKNSAAAIVPGAAAFIIAAINAIVA